MAASRIIKYVLLAVPLTLLLATVLGAVLGQPMGLAYVETGSMEPTIGQGDGFIAVPSVLAGGAGEGDIIVFDAVDIHDGGIVTHRVVDETADGLITRGDANVVTDQDGSEPPVSEGQVEATVLTIGEQPIIVPYLGTAVVGIESTVSDLQQQLAILIGTRAVLGTQGLFYILIAFGAVTYALSAIVERTRENPVRQTGRGMNAINPMAVIGVMTLVLIILLSISMLAPAGAYQFEFVSSETNPTGPDVIQQGTTEQVEYLVPSNGRLPVVAVVEPASEGIEVNHTTTYVPAGEVEEIPVEITAPPETGVHSEVIVEHRYFAVLPMSMILSLHAAHPLLPVAVINVFVGSLFIVFATILIGFDPIRIGRRQPNVPLGTRLRRRLE